VSALCLSLPEVPSNFAKDNRLTNSAQEVMISDRFTFASEKKMLRKLLKGS